MTEATFEDWQKIQLRIGEILAVEDHPQADKLYVLTIDLGEEKRTIVAGIKKHYAKDMLVGKQVIVIANLAPKTLRGITSQGMLLAANDGDHVVFLQPEKKMKNGAVIS
jgi:methionyl-tRNA synthetase